MVCDKNNLHTQVPIRVICCPYLFPVKERSNLEESGNPSENDQRNSVCHSHLLVFFFPVCGHTSHAHTHIYNLPLMQLHTHTFLQQALGDIAYVRSF